MRNCDYTKQNNRVDVGGRLMIYDRDYISVESCEESKKCLTAANIASIKICITSHHAICLKNIIKYNII